MKAIIIAAGTGSRLKKEIINIPKGMLDINGKTILQKQISLFKKHGLDEIILIIGPHREKYNFEGVRYVMDENYQEHDVLCSLMAGRQYIVGDILISYSDILFDESILNQVLNSQVEIGLAVDLNWEQGYIGRTEHPKSEADNVLIQNGKITKIKKNIISKKNNEKMGEFIGLIKLSEQGSKILINKFNKIEKSNVGVFHEAPSLKKGYITDMIQELIESNILVTPILINGKWCEIDTPQDLRRAKKLFK